ncbi:MAG: hypothetical protein JOZ41_11940 [Chloroflexi bacterium]|nr:hypothetical protein [Chloroflexota bacterium]
MFAFPRHPLHLPITSALLLGLTVILTAWRVSAAPAPKSYSFVNFNDPKGVSTTFFGINNARQVVGFYTNGFKQVHALVVSARRKRFAGAKAFTDFVAPQGLDNTAALGINDAGRVVGYYIDGSKGLHGYVWSANRRRFSVLDDPQGVGNTRPFGINNAGQISGFYTDSKGVRDQKGVHGFVRSPDGKRFTNFDDPNGIAGETYAQAINNAGQIVGHYFDRSGFHAFVRSADGKTFTSFDVPQARAARTCGQAITDRGEVVGFFFDRRGGVHGYVRSADGKTFTVIDDPQGIGRTEAFGINNAGQVVGQYVDALGHTHGFVATAVL